MSKHPADGIYETKSFQSQLNWPEDRRVYIQGTAVRLINYRSYGVTDEEHEKHKALGHDLFDFNWFFSANILGSRIGNLPENFDIRKHDNG